MKIYLDIDDTLLNTDIHNTRPANHLKPFLEYMLGNHDVYWLTTHCNGDPTVPVEYLSRFVSPEITALLMRIKPTSWEMRKIDAINLDEDFLWFDDVLMDSEEKLLRSKGKLSSHVMVDLDANPDILSEFIEHPPICKAYIIDILKRSYMLHIWTWPKLGFGWHRKVDGPNKSIFNIKKY